MTISVVFDPPLPSDSPATFNTKAFSTLGDLNDWSTEANALAVEINSGVPIAVATHAAISKTTPVDADEIPMSDSAASWGLKKLTWANLKATVQATLQFLQSGTGAVARGNQDKLRESVSVKDFGAVGDGVTDDLAALQAAASASANVYVPRATYKVSGTINLSVAGSHWFGDGAGLSVITSSSASLPIFTIGSGVSGSIEALRLTRSVTATSGGNGVDSSAVSVGRFKIKDVTSDAQYIGFKLGPTSWSQVSNCVTEKNVNAGCVVVNTAADGACQWYFYDTLSQKNGAQGFLVSAIAGPAQLSVGAFTNCATFANTGLGLGVIGLVAVPIHGVRVAGGFYGEDGNHELYLDTYGDQHCITGAFCELAGTRTTGPTLATAASNTGAGVCVTANNASVQLTGVHAHGNSLDGFSLSGTTHTLGNCRATNNGVAAVAANANGVHLLSGNVVVNGGRYGNSSGSLQQYGVYGTDGTKMSIGFADLTGNTVAAWIGVANPSYVTSVGNLPNNLNVGLSPSGSVLIGAGATGGFTAAGTMNVAGGLFKNNTAYVNP